MPAERKLATMAIAAVGGQSAEFANLARGLHPEQGIGREQRWSSVLRSAGETATWQSGAEFEVRLICDTHSWMNAWLRLLPHPYFAASARQTGPTRSQDPLPGGT